MPLLLEVDRRVHPEGFPAVAEHQLNIQVHESTPPFSPRTLARGITKGRRGGPRQKLGD